MSNLTKTEREELEDLRKSAYKFLTDPLEREFFALQQLLDQPYGNRIDSIMPTSAFRTLARALILLKERIA